MKKITILSAFLFMTIFCTAQRGKDGSPTVSTAIVVNEYTTLKANASTGNTSITVASSTLNAHGRFSGNLAAGDLIMIIQMQGTTINGLPLYWWLGDSNTAQPSDSSWGAVTAYNNCGNYEYAEVNAVPNGTTINLDCGLVNNYTATGNVQIVRVPRYNSLTINNGGSIGCDAWDSATGGIVAIEVLNNTVINAGGSITSTGLGFRGGVLDNDSSQYGVGNTAFDKHLWSWGKLKGEGVAGYDRWYVYYGGGYGKGAAANAGGGSNAHNGGGGGGANGGSVAGYVNGYGNPDITTSPTYATAWNLEFTWLSAFTSAGGGRGGYTFSSNAKNPLTTGPNNSAWGGDHRDANGGWGGRPLDYSTGRLFIGGGGGAGDQDNNVAGPGGAGGGMVYLVSYGTVSGSGQILANGANGGNSTYDAVHGAGDGAGGAGGGGTVVVNSTGNISGITIDANGGVGGNQVTPLLITEAEGPGGGGGGGYIATSNAGVTESAAGGWNGTTSSKAMTKFPPNGATKGGAGTTGATITNFQIVAKNDTICSGQTATLTATLTGTVPGGTTIEWYTTQTGGAPIASGASYTTPALVVNTTYYVGTCPGSYRQAVNVIIGGSASTTISGPATICSGASTPLTATGGTSYTWAPAGSLSNPNIANPTATPAATTTYTVTIVTPCGNQKDSVKITVNPGPTVTITPTGSTTLCAGGAGVVLNGGGATTYSWGPAAGLSATTGTPVTANPPSTTTYTVTGTTAGCTGKDSIKVTVNPLPTITTVPSGSATICSGSSVLITTSGASTYTWGPSTGLSATTGAGVTANPTVNTIYTVTGTSAAGCTNTQTVSITVNTTPTVTITPTGSTTLCAGGAGVVLNAGGAAAYTWGPAAGLTATTGTPVTANPAGTTTYTLTGTNAGCTGKDSVTVTVNPLPTITTAPSGSTTICSGTSFGITASGASTYTWGPAAGLSATTGATVTANPTSTTIYTVTGTSAAGCSNTQTITVNVNAKPVVTVNPPAPGICSGGNVALTASGGATYTWSPATALSATTGATVTASPVATTTYTVIGTSAAGCTDTTNVTVTVSSSLVASVSGKDTVCAGSSTALTAAGGSTYKWSTGSTNATINVSPASTTTYKVVVSSGSCKDSTNVTVTVEPTITPSVSASAPTICSGNSTTLTASGGTTYLWNTGQTSSSISVSPVATTSYTVNVSNSSCSVKDSITITVNPTPVPTINPSSTVCAGTPVNLTAGGGAIYSWTPAAGLSATTGANVTATPASTTTYIVTVTNGVCSKDTNVTITVNPVPVVTITGGSSICSGNSTTLTASGGGTYSWNTGSTNSSINVSPVITTGYTVTVSNGTCSVKDSVTVTVNTTPVPTVNPSSTVCAGTPVNLTAGGGATYSWTPAAGLSATTGANVTATPASTTTYIVTVSNGGCSKDTNVTITVNPVPVVSITGNNSICSGANTTLTASGGGTYNWNTGSTNSSINVSPVATTGYTVTVSNGTCSVKDSVTVTVNVTPVPTVNPSSSVCAGTPVSLTAGGGATYSWTPATGLSATTGANVTATPATTTTYSVTVSNGGCSKDTNVTITVNPVPVVTISGINSICSGNNTVLTATGGGTYLWTTSSTNSSITVTPATTTTYSVLVTLGSCSKDTSITVTVNTTPSPTISGPQTICAGESVPLTAGGGGTYAWTPAAGLSSTVAFNPTASPATTTYYTVTVSNGPCSAKDSVKVTVNPGPTGVACCGGTIVSGSSTTLAVTPASAGNTYNWSPGTALSCVTCPDPVASPTVTTTYIVTITDSNGCSKSDTLVINVEEDCGQFFLPDAFSPNGDKENDVLLVRYGCIQAIDFVIYDRWGNKVFESTDPTIGWDGKYNGQLMNSGVYVYYVNILTLQGTNLVQKGNITLVR